MPISTRLAGLVLVILLSLGACLPFFHSGFFPVHDDTQVARVYEMGQGLKDGMFPVRWTKDLGYGYGYPIFNFYSPLPYYIGGLFTVLGFDSLTATKLLFAGAILLSGTAMFLFAEAFFGRTAAILASVLYVYFPYHAVNIFVRGDLDELTAYAFLPFVFLGLYKLYQVDQETGSIKRYGSWIVVLSISLSLTVLSHNLSAYMTSLLLVIFLPFLILSGKKKKILAISFVAAFILAFLLSSFYIIPALGELAYTNIFSQVGGGAAYYDHYVCPLQLWDSPWGFGGSVKGCIDGMSFRLGKLNTIIVAFSFLAVLCLLIRKKIKVSVFHSSFILLLVSLFLLLPYSKPVWDVIPEMPVLQYPWRFLNLVGLFLALSSALAFFEFQKKANKYFTFLTFVIIIILTLYTNGKLFVPQMYTQKPAVSYESRSYLSWTVSKISDEYMPVGFSIPGRESDVSKNPLLIQNGSGRIGNIFHTTGALWGTIFAFSDLILHINIAPFPGWHAYVDGKETHISNSPQGMSVSIPKGVHLISVKFLQTPVETVGNVLSAIGVAVLLLGIILMQRCKKYAKTI